MKLFPSVDEVPLPNDTLLQEFVDSGEYTDCFVATVAGNVTFAEYVEAFYTTRLFKLERFILQRAISKPSTDQQANQIALGEINSFAAWNEHSRSNNQLIMMDFRQKTCSWFMLLPGEAENSLYFGSAVIRDQETASGREMAWTFRWLLGFHRLYSRALLHAAAKRLRVVS